MQIYNVIPQRLDVDARPEFASLILGMTSATYPFLIKSTDGSESVSIYHDNTYTWITPTTSTIQIRTSTNDTSTNFEIRGRGTGLGRAYIRSGNLAAIWALEADNAGNCNLTVLAGTNMNLIANALVPITLFANSTEGETQELRIYGYRNADDKRYLKISVGEDAANAARFSGLSEYRFHGTIRANTAFDCNGNTGLSATYTFSGGGSGDIASMTFTGGILTAVTTVP